MATTDKTTFDANKYVLNLSYGTGKKRGVKRPSTIAELEEVERIARDYLLRTMEDNDGALGTEIPELSEIVADESGASDYCYEITGFASDLLADARTWTLAANALLEARARLASKATKKTA